MSALLAFPVRPAGRRYRPSGRTLRERFELLGLCPGGFVIDAKRCWDAIENDPEIARQIADATAWLELCRPANKRPRFVNSYELKHECERWLRSERGRGVDGYVASGSLTMAAYNLGFRVRHEEERLVGRERRRSIYPNSWVAVSNRRPGKLRPDGSHELSSSQGVCS